MPNRVKTALVVLGLLTLSGCDPGMYIHRATATGPLAHSKKLDVRVDEEWHLIGERYYSPGISVTNHFDSAVSVSSVDLITNTGTYRIEPFHWAPYPVRVSPGKTKTLRGGFQLRAPVYDTFCPHPAELRVHYRRLGTEAVSTASMTAACPWVWRGWELPFK